jgi:glucose-1-phosphate cytidylyltransferase
MKVIILAGGFGSRLSEYTGLIPKPMVLVGQDPMVLHIMKTYAKYNHNDFFLALGYKAEYIKDYFLKYKSLSSDFTIDFKTGEHVAYEKGDLNWKVTLIDTGLDSMTGGRVKRLRDYIGNETFLLTYGDGLSNINIDKLIEFHRGHGKMVTVSAVHPIARFGELSLNGNNVTSFNEKPQIKQGWINGGYFVIEPDFFDLIEGDNTILEKEPLEMAAKMGELVAYKHDGFWRCMDTKRDKDSLDEMYQLGNAPWLELS